MARVALHRASAEAVERTVKPLEAVDTRGRKFLLRKPSILAQYRLVDMIGGESSKNEVYMGMILPILWVAAIDGESVPTPRTKLELEALIEQVDEDGLVAIAGALAAVAAPADPELEQLKNG